MSAKQWVDDLLGSVRTFGGCPDARLVVFALGDAPALDEIATQLLHWLAPWQPLLSLRPSLAAGMNAVTEEAIRQATVEKGAAARPSHAQGNPGPA
jgi:hypothetical protein